MAGVQASGPSSEATSVAGASEGAGTDSLTTGFTADDETGLTDEDDRTAEYAGSTADEAGTAAEDNVTADETGTTAEDKTLLELEGSVSGFAAEDSSEVEDED